MPANVSDVLRRLAQTKRSVAQHFERADEDHDNDADLPPPDLTTLSFPAPSRDNGHWFDPNTYATPYRTSSPLNTFNNLPGSSSSPWRLQTPCPQPSPAPRLLTPRILGQPSPLKYTSPQPGAQSPTDWLILSSPPPDPFLGDAHTRSSGQRNTRPQRPRSSSPVFMASQLPPIWEGPLGSVDPNLGHTGSTRAQNERPPQPEPEADIDFGDDDGWILQAIDEVTKAEAAATIKRTSTRSPYFSAPASENQPLATHRPGSTSLQVPSRRNTISPAVRFPKLPLSRPPSTQSIRSPAPRSQRNAKRNQAPVKSTGRTAILSQAATGDGNLISVNALDTLPERQIFQFDHFNDMQSVVFQSAYNSHENLVVAAPTGSGKTTVFELAFLHMLKEQTDSYNPVAIYMAPTKALCSERVQDWRNRLQPLDVQCIELTGDTEINDIFRYLEKFNLIVTTPEKWDSLTRRTSMSRVVDRLRLMMIDEVHILHESRGATLEVVVSRMKARGDNVRFVAASASVPNINDVARWIGSTDTQNDPDEAEEQGRVPLAVLRMPKAKVFKFGEEFRPVPLKRITCGYDAPNDFVLGNKLDKELFPILNRHGAGLPVLVFCPTRKACHTTAEHLAKEYQAAQDARRPLPWDASENKRLILKDAKVQALTESGIAVHHAGLDLLDRRAIEQAFRDSQLHLVVATSTLAVGVNLPAHLVIIKGTAAWNGKEQGFREYSDVDIQQMMGRAGRPQYDTTGTVVVMCQRSKVSRYQDVLNSRMILESCLHEHLTEHINSEIGLQTITSLKSAQDWLRNSFLYVRIQQNPRHYMGTLVKDHTKTWEETLDGYVENALNDLEKHEFVACEEPTNPDLAYLKEGLHPTSSGKIMSQTFISYSTMCLIVSMDPDSSFRDLLELLSGADEFTSLRIRQGEAGVLNKLRTAEAIRFQLTENVKTYADKVFLHLQVTFGNVNLDQFATKSENASPLQTQIAIFNSAPRIARAILLVASEKKYGGATRSALELVRTVNGKAWEDSATIFRQIDKIGPKSIAVLASNGVNTWDDLLKLDPGRLETWLNRHSPFGYDVIERANEFPRFVLKFANEEVITKRSEWPWVRFRVTIQHKGILVHKAKTGQAKWTKSSYSLTVLFLSSKDNRFIDLRRIDTSKLNDHTRELIIEATLHFPEEEIVAIAGVEEKAGLARTFQYHPRIPAARFPSPEEVRPRDGSSEDDVPVARTAGHATKEVEPSVSKPKPLSSKQALVVPDDSDDEIIDLTGPPSKMQPPPPRPTSSSNAVRSSKRQSVLRQAVESSKRPSNTPEPPAPKRSKISPPSPAPVDVPMAEEDDDTQSVNSLDEFEPYFRHAPSPMDKPVSSLARTTIAGKSTSTSTTVSTPLTPDSGPSRPAHKVVKTVRVLEPLQPSFEQLSQSMPKPLPTRKDSPDDFDEWMASLLEG